MNGLTGTERYSAIRFVAEGLMIAAFWTFMWPVLLVWWLEDHDGWTLGIGWGSLIVIVALIVRGAL